MKRMLVFGLVVFVLFAPLMTIATQRAFADPHPTVGLGYIFDFDHTPYEYDLDVDGSQDAQKNWVVSGGVTYLVTLREVEFDHANISVHGKYQDGTKWEIVIGTDIANDGSEVSGRGWYYWFSVVIPSSAGCTGTVHYRKGPSDASGNPNGETHNAAEEPADVWDPTVQNHFQKTGHFKLYYTDGKPVPCEALGVPEFPFASAVATSIGLIGALLIKRRQKKLK